MNLKEKLSDNLPGILIGFGVASLWTAVGLTVKATSKARDILDAERAKTLTRDKDGNEIFIEPTFKEKVKLTWKCFLPPVLVGAAGTATIITGSVKGAKKTTAFATAAAMAAETVKDQQEAIKEVVGEEKAKEVQKKVSEKRQERYENGCGGVCTLEEPPLLMKDAFTGEYFYGTHSNIEQVQHYINTRVPRENSVTLNEAYSAAGIYLTSEVSYNFGFKVDDYGYFDDDVILDHWDSEVAPNGKPYILVSVHKGKIEQIN